MVCGTVSLFILFLEDDLYVFLLDVGAVGENGILLGADGDVLEVDTIHRHLGKAIELHGATCTTANDILNIDMTEDRRGLVDGLLRGVIGLVAIGYHLSYGLATIIHIKGNGIGLDVHHRDIADKDILYDTATATGALKAKTDIGTQELTMADLEVLDATAHLGAYDEAAMACKDGATIDHNILARHATTTTIGILTALDTDTIVARIELGIDNERILTRL